MVEITEEMRKYIIPGRIRTISKNAPDYIKQEALDIDKKMLKITGKHFFDIEKD